MKLIDKMNAQDIAGNQNTISPSQVLSEVKIVVAAFYKFVTLNDLDDLKVKLKDFMFQHDIRGTVLLASEGINSTVSGTRESIDSFLNLLKSDPSFADLEHKEAYFSKQVFKRIKVKIKKEIISLGRPVNPNEKVGKYITPQEWNELINDPEVLLIDTRNDYEVEIGSFEGAINPNTHKFSDLPQFTDEYINKIKPKKIAMYCTGGIRCEKYSAYMLEQGYNQVYHLQGGILKYLEEIPETQSKWKGDCFVFDDRRSVNHKVYETQSGS